VQQERSTNRADNLSVTTPQPLTPTYTTELGALHQTDCLTVLAATPSNSIDLVFADPPFNLSKNYGAGINDNLTDSDYVAWCDKWVTECARVCTPGGAVFVYNLPKWNIEIAQQLNQTGLTLRHWITVDMKLGLPIKGKLYPAHYSLLYYTKGKPKTFLRPRVPIQTCRHCGGDVKDYGGHRSKIHPDGVNVSDVWADISPVRHKTTKKRGANQLSEKLLSRVLDIASQPGDTVFDPFGGSGTTFAVAEQMGRRWIGCEIGDIDPIIRRLEGRAALAEMPNKGDAGKSKRAH
jgi:site-specific DNA-methyltransferase (adenine-specific)